jgi:hypothetical protein
VVPASATLPAPTPLTVPAAGLPAVPDGTVMVRAVSVAVVAVVATKV